MSQSFLSVEGFKKTFGDVVAVDNVSLSLSKGEFLTFLGPSGSGKSTTLYAIAGFDIPTEGDIRIEGKSILSIPSHKRNIGMVFQRYTLFPHLTISENIAFPLRVRRRSAAEISARVKEMIALVRLEGFEHRMPSQLSGGQQQRVALARALAYDPPVLLMDEPLSALDKKLRDELQIEIRRIHQQTGVTILYVTHDQEEALRLSDRIAVFNHGRIEQIGSGNELYRSPKTRFVAGFIGDSNFLRVEQVSAIGHDEAIITMPDGTLFDKIPLQHSLFAATQTCEIMMRPQSIRLAKDDEIGLEVVVLDVTFLGESVSLYLATKWGETLMMRIPERSMSGNLSHKHIRIAWERNESHLFFS